MADWVAIKFFYATMLGSAGSTFTATSTATGDFDVDYLYSMFETSFWEATTSANQQLDYDAGVGNTKTADYLVILGHNLATVGATIVLQYSDGAGYTNAFTPIVVTVDTVLAKEFSGAGAHRYWRLDISGGMSAAPSIAIAIWGDKTEIGFARASYDPKGFEEEVSRNITAGGFPAGIHEYFSEREFSIPLSKIDEATYAKLLAWREISGAQQLFVAWETANNPDDVFLVYPVGKFHCPFTNGGLYRRTTLNFRGRKAA